MPLGPTGRLGWGLLGGIALVFSFLWPRFANAEPFSAEEDDLLQFAPRAEQVDVLYFDGLPRAEAMPQMPRGGAPFWISIAANAKLQSSGKQSFGATLLLDIPLERFGRSSSRFFGQESVPQLKPLPRAKPQTPPPPSPPLPEDRTPAKTESEPRQASEQEPKSAASISIPPELLRASIRSALKHAHLEDAAARVDAMASRARGAALLPELRLRVSRLVDEEQALSPTEYDPHRTTASGGTSLWLEARASWRLDRLVFSDDEPAFEKMRWERAEAREKLTAKVLELLVAWMRAKAGLLKEELSEEERMELELKAMEAEMGLDALTGGMWGKILLKVKHGGTGASAGH